MGCHSSNNGGGGGNGNGDKTGDKNNGEIVFPDFDLSLPSVVGAAVLNTEESRDFVNAYLQEVKQKSVVDRGVVKLLCNYDDKNIDADYGDIEETKVFVTSYFENNQTWIDFHGYYKKGDAPIPSWHFKHMFFKGYGADDDEFSYFSLEKASTKIIYIMKRGNIN